VFASHFQEGTAYVTKSGFRNDDFRPLVFKTTDYGATWTSLAGNLPQSPANVIFEDRTNPDLLFLGTDTGVFVSIDGGKKWLGMNIRIPKAPVHDLLVHPRENDLVVATYGRGLFVTDVTALQQTTAQVLAEDVHLFDPEPRAQRIVREFAAEDYLFGDRHLLTPNEPNGVVINYYLKSAAAGKAVITIADPFGREWAKIEGPTDAGIHPVLWDMRRRMTREEQAAARMQRSGDPFARWAPPGDYIVTLEIGGRTYTGKARITKRTGWSIGPVPEIIRERS